MKSLKNAPFEVDIDGTTILDRIGRTVAITDVEKLNNGIDEDAPNHAELFAAAPDLLYVLKCILKESDKLHEAHFQLAVAAVAKAEGKQ